MEPKDLKRMNSIQHPLHPQHTLTLFQGSDLPQYFICNRCRELRRGYFESDVFGCHRCKFYLHPNCAVLMDKFSTQHDRVTYEDMEKNDNILHFSHTHVLKLGRLTNPLAYGYCCCSCRRNSPGYVYCCSDCKFFIHECCMDEMKEEVIHPFHPQHPLRAYALNKNDRKTLLCQACRKYDIDDVSLGCEKCKFHLHYSCAREPFPRPLKLPYHDHNLYYFARDAEVEYFKCQLCPVKDKSCVYRCLECCWTDEGNFHIECISIRGKVKHKSHDCELILCDSVKGFDSPKYRCNICKESGNSRHHVYGCQKCNYTAHIECVISEEQTSDKRASSSVPGLEIDVDQEKETGQETDSDEESSTPSELDDEKIN